MFKRFYITILLLGALFTSCDNSSTNSANEQTNKTRTQNIPIQESIDNNFNEFIEKFSTDFAFQLCRVKFPLKTKWIDFDNGRDTLIYTDRSSFEMMDFRAKKSTGQYDQWEQKIVVDKSNTSATIKIRGIDNGIMVDYLFEKINGAWTLIEIDDSST